jgi:hypothetical protein
MFDNNAYGNGLDVGVGGDDVLDGGPDDAMIRERDQEARYREFKEQLLREKSHINKMQEIEHLKGEITKEIKKLQVVKQKNMYSDDFFSRDEIASGPANRSLEVGLAKVINKPYYNRPNFFNDRQR